METSVTIDSTKELAPVKARATKMGLAVNSLVIKDDASLAEATKIRAGIKDVAKSIDQKKKEITAPLNLALKNTRALFAPLEVACDEASRELDRKVITYNREIEEVRRQAEERLASRVEKGTLKIETAAKKMEALPEAQRHVTTDKGSMTIVKVKKFEVTDVSKLPLEYILPNDGAIRKAMYTGTQLEGVRYWEEDRVSGR